MLSGEKEQIRHNLIPGNGFRRVYRRFDGLIVPSTRYQKWFPPFHWWHFWPDPTTRPPTQRERNIMVMSIESPDACEQRKPHYREAHPSFSFNREEIFIFWWDYCKLEKLSRRMKRALIFSLESHSGGGVQSRCSQLMRDDLQEYITTIDTFDVFIRKRLLYWKFRVKREEFIHFFYKRK